MLAILRGAKASTEQDLATLFPEHFSFIPLDDDSTGNNEGNNASGAACKRAKKGKGKRGNSHGTKCLLCIRYLPSFSPSSLPLTPTHNRLFASSHNHSLAHSWYNRLILLLTLTHTHTCTHTITYLHFHTITRSLFLSHNHLFASSHNHLFASSHNHLFALSLNSRISAIRMAIRLHRR